MLSSVDINASKPHLQSLKCHLQLGCNESKPHTKSKALSSVDGNTCKTQSLKSFLLQIHHNFFEPFNPFLSAHIPCVQSDGILPQNGIPQWLAHIFRSTQRIATKLYRNVVEASSLHKKVKYWWPLTLSQGHVIQDGRQIHFWRSNSDQ